jgi:uncharacterized protein with FMN-binding domain
MAEAPEQPRAKTPGRSGSRVTNRLVALSSAAVLTVYSAGYLRTRAAADKLFAAERTRAVVPGTMTPGPPISTTLASATEAPMPAEAVRPITSPVATTPALQSSAASSQNSPKPAVTAAEATPIPTPDASSSASPSASPAPTPAATTTTELVASSTPAASPVPTAPAYKDGTFSGWGTSRHGDIEATVVITSGKIVSAVISQCWTRYSCSWVAHLPGQVVTRQSAEVDYVSGATQSANAFYYAVVQALSKAK